MTELLRGAMLSQPIRYRSTSMCLFVVVLMAWSVLVACGSEEWVQVFTTQAVTPGEPQGVLSLVTDLVISGGGGRQPWHLGKPRAVAESHDGQVFVLDSDWKRISVHSIHDGSLLRLVGNGYGVGPGQFALPVDMEFADSLLFVLDYELRRISVYDTSGTFIKDIPVEGVYARSFALVDHHFWIKLMFPDEGRAVAVLDNDGKHVRNVVRLNRHDRQLYESGAGGELSASRFGDAIIYVHGDGGLQSTVDATFDETLVMLAPPARILSETTNGVALPWLLPSRAVLGVTVLANGWTVLLVSTLDASALRDPSEIRPTYLLAVYEADGGLLGKAPLEEKGMPLAVNGGLGDPSVYVSFTGEIPRVVRFRLEIAPLDQLDGEPGQ